MITVLDPGVAIHDSELGADPINDPPVLLPFTGALKKGDVVYIDPSFVTIEQSDSDLTAGSVTINFPENYFGNIDQIRAALENRVANPQAGDPTFDVPAINFPTLKLTATLQVSKAKPRLKTSIENKQIIVQSGGTNIVPFRGQENGGETIQIVSYSDVYKLRYVYEGSVSAPPTVDAGGNLVSGTDVTDKYTFDNGQRDTFYDTARLVLKPGVSAPTGQLISAFDYFEHSQGDFCTIDSYLHEAGVTETEIPTHSTLLSMV